MSTIDWLADFQGRFSSMLRTPLDNRGGSLRAASAVFDARLCDEAIPGRSLRGCDRLAIYNRQYWFRLFGLLQSAFPLTTRLLGHWTFNGYAAGFFLAHPPRGWNIDRAPDGFETFLADTGGATVRLPDGTLDRLALLEAAEIDAAWRRVFLAPSVAPYRPSPADAECLARGRLRPSPTAAFFDEHWPLLELRRALVDHPGEAPVPLPPALSSPQSWALVRKPAGIGQLLLAPREAQLFSLLREHPVRDALAHLESACPQEERAQLPAKAQRWLASSVELDMWCGLDDQP